MSEANSRGPFRNRVGSMLILLLASAVFALGCGEDGATGEQGPEGPEGPPGPTGPPGDVADTATSVEACLGCHGPGGVSPVVDIDDPADAHHVDLDPLGPATRSGYRQLAIEVLSVDVSSTFVDLSFRATDETGGLVDDLFAADGRFALGRLLDPVGIGAATTWEALLTGERFTTDGGVFTPGGSGLYDYRSVFDPATAGVTAGDTLRVAVQVNASDLPTGNGICNFDAAAAAPNDCTSGTSRTRDIVPTSQCNSCHGVTSDSKLAFHGGGRTDVDYCVVCHTPDLGDDGDADMTVMTHKIHAGAELENGYRGYSSVHYTRDLDDCTTCHGGGGADEMNWAEVPTRAACGSCHDEVNFADGTNHGSGGVQGDDSLCANCHPPLINDTGSKLPVQVVHQGVERNLRAAEYRAPGDGFVIEDVAWDVDTDELTLQYSVKRLGTRLDLETAPEFPGGGGSGRVNLRVAWSTSEYTNEGSGSSAPAQPVSYSGTDFTDVVNAGGEVFERVIPVPNGAFDTVTVTMEGYPATDLDPDGVFDDAVPVKSTFEHEYVELRGAASPRRDSVDMAKCNLCHDAAGAGLSLHGNNRTGEAIACLVCHNPDATDIDKRLGEPEDHVDGKREESVDFKRLIHGIHAGAELENGLVVYGYRSSVHDFSDVGFIGNLVNCETCHIEATPSDSPYGAEAAWATLASTIDTGDDVMDPSDDLNVSPVASVCSSCHDNAVARGHMLLHGASFIALDEDIH